MTGSDDFAGRIQRTYQSHWGRVVYYSPGYPDCVARCICGWEGPGRMFTFHAESDLNRHLSTSEQPTGGDA